MPIFLPLNPDTAATYKWDWLKQIKCDSPTIPDPLIEGLCDNNSYFYNPIGHRGVVVLVNEALKLMRSLQAGLPIDRIMRESDIYKNDNERFFRCLYALADSELLYLSDDFTMQLNERRCGRRLKPKTFYVWLQMTDNCNLECSYCFVNKKVSAISPDMAKTIVNKIANDARALGFDRVVFKLAGGEPMLEYKTVTELVEWAEKSIATNEFSVRFSLITNGTFLPINILDLMSSGRLGVSISLDGVDKWHNNERKYKGIGSDSFSDVDRTINQLLKYNVKPFVLVTVGLNNIDGLCEVAEYCISRNLRFRFSVRRLNRIDNDSIKHDNRVLAEGLCRCYEWISNNVPKESLYTSHKLGSINLLHPRTRVCGLGVNSATVSTTGGVSLCPQYDLDNPIAQFDNGNVVDLVSKQQRYDSNKIHVLSNPECEDCMWRYTCGGGCPLFTQAHYECLTKKSPHCEIYQEVLPYFIRMHAAQLIKITSERR